MSKIVCEVCGTAYPDTSHQCPICGCAKPADAGVQSSQPYEEDLDSGYAYVKGGRFSKSNVRKRNNMAKASAMYVEDDPEEDEVPQESNRGLTIAIILLLLAIIAVAAYIYIRFFAPSGKGDKPVITTTPAITTTAPDTTPQATTTAPETTPEVTTPAPTTTDSLACTGVTLKDQSITFNKISSSWQLTPTVEPANTPDQIVYSSADPKVAIVDASGRVTAVGNGTTTITVTCGSVSAQCKIVVEIPAKDETLRFNTYDPFLGILTEGDGFRIRMYDKDDSKKTPLEVTDWTSSKPGVATVNKDGLIVAKSQGTTVISCVYKGWKYECTIIVEPKPTTAE